MGSSKFVVRGERERERERERGKGRRRRRRAAATKEIFGRRGVFQRQLEADNQSASSAAVCNKRLGFREKLAGKNCWK
jgi:hypothetical protein